MNRNEPSLIRQAPEEMLGAKVPELPGMEKPTPPEREYHSRSSLRKMRGRKRCSK